MSSPMDITPSYISGKTRLEFRADSEAPTGTSSRCNSGDELRGVWVLAFCVEDDLINGGDVNQGRSGLVGIYSDQYDNLGILGADRQDVVNKLMPFILMEVVVVGTTFFLHRGLPRGD